MHRHLRSTGLSELASDTLSETLPINLEAYLYYPDTLYKGIALLINDILDIANASQVFAETQQRLEKLLSKSTLGTRRYRTYLTSVLRDALSTTALL